MRLDDCMIGRGQHLDFWDILGSVLGEVEVPEEPVTNGRQPPERAHGGFHGELREALRAVVHVRSEWLPCGVDNQPVNR